MDIPDEEHDQSVKDSRMECKYGVNCYQKNPQHLKKYKHPTNKRLHTEVIDGVKNKSPKRIKLAKASTSSSNVFTKVGTSQLSNQNGTTAASSLTDLLSDSTTEQDAKLVDKNRKTSDIQPTPKVSLCTSADKKNFIKENFLVEMPSDFYTFWDYCKTVKPENPSKAFSNIDLHLVGPYDVLAGRFSNIGDKSLEEYLIHWRYYYDPPEFQTVIKGPDATGFHIGYFRDDPKQMPVFVAGNHAKKDGEISIMGENVFAAVGKFLETTMKSCDPFKKMNLTKIHGQLKAHAQKLNLNLSENTDCIKERNKKIVTSSFNKAGLVVPYNRKTQLGYRNLYISNKEVRKLLDRVASASEVQRSNVLAELQPVLTAASIATDECDFGTGLELGWNILAHGVDSLNTTIEQYLCTAYNLLDRSAFTKIASAHMAKRRKGTNLSIL